MHPEPYLTSGSVLVRRGRREDVPEIVWYFARNRLAHAPYSPRRPTEFFTESYWLSALDEADAAFRADRLLHCFVFLPNDPRVVGVVNLSNFVRGAFQACHLSYSIDRAHEGTGVMASAARLLIDYAFSTLGMHRVMANYMPENERSGRLLERLGFEREGFARRYLCIDGKWRDHVLTSRINDHSEPG